MVTQRKLIESYQTTHMIIHKQAEGLTHEESVLQLPFRGNCFNWVVGHIVEHRDKVLVLLDESPQLTAQETAVYATGSDPITQQEMAIPFDTLLATLDETQDRIIAILNRIRRNWAEVAVEKLRIAVIGRTGSLNCGPAAADRW